MTISLSTTIRNAEADAITSAIGSNGLLRIYSGTPPATVGTALSGNTQLAELALSATAAPAASGGVLTFNAITQALPALRHSLARPLKRWRTSPPALQAPSPIMT